jgi:hypothetical protein
MNAKQRRLFMAENKKKSFRLLLCLAAFVLIVLTICGITFCFEWSAVALNEFSNVYITPPPPPPQQPPSYPPDIPPPTGLQPPPPDYDDIGDPNLPGGGLSPDDLPKTGDWSDPTFWLIAAAVSAIVLRRAIFFDRYDT